MSLLPALQLYVRHRLWLQMMSPAQNGGTQFNWSSAIFCKMATHPPAFSKSISSLLLIVKRIMWFSRSVDEIHNICWHCWLKTLFFGGINLTRSCSSPFLPSDKSRVPTSRVRAAIWAAKVRTSSFYSLGFTGLTDDLTPPSSRSDFHKSELKPNWLCICTNMFFPSLLRLWCGQLELHRSSSMMTSAQMIFFNNWNQFYFFFFSLLWKRTHF